MVNAQQRVADVLKRIVEVLRAQDAPAIENHGPTEAPPKTRP
jgi:hypothetical protein